MAHTIEVKHAATAAEFWSLLSPEKPIFPAPSNLLYRGQADDRWNLTPGILRKGMSAAADMQVFKEWAYIEIFVRHCDSIGLAIGVTAGPQYGHKDIGFPHLAGFGIGDRHGDLIFVFVKAYYAAHRKQAKRIEKEFVQQEARQWYEQDKYQNLDAALRRALNALIRRVVTRARSTTFLVRTGDEKTSVFQQLLDARVVHLLRRGFVDSDPSGDRYSVFTLDYGTYAHLDRSRLVRFGESRLINKLIISQEMLT